MRRSSGLVAHRLRRRSVTHAWRCGLLKLFRNTCAVATLAAALPLAPLGAFAQQMPPPPDGTSVNEPPAAGPQAAVDACGNTPQAAFGSATDQGTPQRMDAGEPKDVGAAQQRENMSSVDGIVVHPGGNLVLLRIPMEPAMGVNNATAANPMAVIRLPDGCAPALSDGTRLQVTGMPTTDGILNAELVQLDD